MKSLLKSKTVWTGIAGVVTAAGGYFTGSMDANTAIQLAVTSILAIFIRSGINEAGK